MSPVFNSILTRYSKFLRKQKLLGFCLFGGIGALAGSFIGVTIFGNSGALGIPLWDAFTAIGIGYAISSVQAASLHRHSIFALISLRTAVLSGLAGAFAGVVFIFSRYFIDGEYDQIVAWALEGLTIGAVIGTIIPNLPKKTSAIAGTFAGLLGFLTMLYLSKYLPDTLAVSIGDSLKGALIGLMIVVSEDFNKRSSNEPLLEIEWSEKETTTFLLGNEPIRFGTSSKCQIYLRGDKSELPILAEVRYENKEAFLVDFVNDARIVIREGLKIRIGNLLISISFNPISTKRE